MFKNKAKSFSSIILILLFPTFVLLGTSILVKLTPGKAPKAKTDTKAELTAVPNQLSIPSLGITAQVMSVGIDSDGRMGSPDSPASVGWYELGSKPGDIGTAVVAGHVDWLDKKPAIFSLLKDIELNSEVIVLDDNGKELKFRVKSKKVYRQDENPNEVFISDDTEAHLNLITCTGTWDLRSKTYTDRLVVFTTLE